MGSAPSKASGQEDGYVFQTTTVPISFSSNFVQTLEDASATDAEREQHIEYHVQERVAAELARLRELEDTAFAKTTYDLSKQNIAASTDSDLNSVILEADVQELKKALARSSQYAELKGVAGVEAKQSAVIQCLREKHGRSLDCKAEVDQFKASVRDLQQEFIVRYH